MRNATIIKGVLLLCFCMTILDQKLISQTSSRPTKINWVNNINDNFSFTKKWSYPEGVYKNKYGQLVCDGFCPEGIENMTDRNNRINKDSLKAYYQIVDTSHLFHTISCDAWCYEWAGIDFINVFRISDDTLYCATQLNAATHCSLQLIISNDTCIAIINLLSIVAGRKAKYFCTNGEITIDKNLLKQGFFKAKFNFNFAHPENPKKAIFWRGKIYTAIEPDPAS